MSTLRHRVLLPTAALSGALLLAGCSGSSGYGSTAPSPAATKVAATGTIGIGHTPAGSVLTDGRGRTMYAFAADRKGHSACTGSCLSYWPPVPAGGSLPGEAAGVTAALGVLHRPDGTAQLTVAGWPMYTYVGDTAPGQATGQGRNLSGGLWWAVAPSGTWVTSSPSPSSGRRGY